MISSVSLSVVLLSILVVFFAIDYGFMHRYDRQRASRKGWNWDYTLFTFGFALLVVLQPWLLPVLGWNSTSGFGLGLQILGMALILASFVIHTWARRHLRQFYVERVEVQENHQVIQTGPYAYVRHPIITTFFGVAVGLVCLNPSVVTMLVLGYTVWDFSRAARQEEQVLSKSLPEYEEYMARTPRFFPRIGQ